MAPPGDAASPRGRGWASRLLPAMLLLAALAAGEGAYLVTSPDVILLPPGQGGEWIRPSGEVDLQARSGQRSVAWYRKRFSLPPGVGEVAGSVTALGHPYLFVDGVPVPLAAAVSWKEAIPYRLAGPDLGPGQHELALRIENDAGPPLVRHASPLHPLLATPEGWEFSPDGIRWLPATPCDRDRFPALRNAFPTVGEGLARSLPLLLPAFVGGLLLWSLRGRLPASLRTARALRYVLLAAWAILGAVNMAHGTKMVGFDSTAHMDYTAFLLTNHSLPLATDGGQMFQTPLHYLLTAALLSAVSFLKVRADLFLLLLALPLACGLLLVELSYRTLREFFPGDEARQAAGLVVSSLLPMNLYMCQSTGNEPLASVLTSLLILMAVRSVRRPTPFAARDAVSLGVVAGLAVLAKVTALLLVPPILWLALSRPREPHGEAGRRAGPAALFLASVAAVSGWYFVRNVIHFGKPFVGGWDPAGGLAWWQEPGYRLARDFLAFGESLRNPVFACFNGLPDALYSTLWGDGYLSGVIGLPDVPEWNFPLLAATAALSLLPAAAILAGFLAATKRGLLDGEREYGFLVLSAFLVLAALVHLYAAVPIYSQGKASYTMGLTPAWGVMAALGAGPLLRRPAAAPFLAGWLAAWGVASYGSFLIL